MNGVYASIIALTAGKFNLFVPGEQALMMNGIFHGKKLEVMTLEWCADSKKGQLSI